MTSIILIGMPGVGKSTIGIELSDTLNVDCIDTDRLIEKKVKNRLNDFIQMVGEEEFKSVEEAIILNLNVRGCIISTGGSVIYSKHIMKHLKKLGKIVYLEAPYDVIENRVSKNPNRGIVGGGKTLKELYDERTPMYKKWADYTVDANKDIGEICFEIIKTVEV